MVVGLQFPIRTVRLLISLKKRMKGLRSVCKMISVIVPVYNVEQYLDRCVNSIIHQTYRDLEIILVDDGSPDQCPQMCDEWSKKDNRIKVIHKKNGGLSSARNAGLDIASGDYIAFVDSDDYIDNQMLELMLDAAERNNAPVVCCGRIRVTTSTKVEMFTLPQEKIFTGEEAIKEIFLSRAVEEAAWDKLYRAEIFANRRFPLGEINEDIVQTINILGSCDRIVHVGRALYYYCENYGSITKSGYNKNKAVVLSHLETIYSYISEMYPSLIENYCYLEARYCQGLLYLLLSDKRVLDENRADYERAYSKFKSAFKTINYGRRMPPKERIKGMLIYTGWYLALHNLKKRNKLRRFQ